MGNEAREDTKTTSTTQFGKNPSEVVKRVGCVRSRLKERHTPVGGKKKSKLNGALVTLPTGTAGLKLPCGRPQGPGLAYWQIQGHTGGKKTDHGTPRKKKKEEVGPRNNNTGRKRKVGVQREKDCTPGEGGLKSRGVRKNMRHLHCSRKRKRDQVARGPCLDQRERKI